MAVTKKYNLYYVKGPYYNDMIELRNVWTSQSHFCDIMCDEEFKFIGEYSVDYAELAKQFFGGRNKRKQILLNLEKTTRVFFGEKSKCFQPDSADRSWGGWRLGEFFNYFVFGFFDSYDKLEFGWNHDKDKPFSLANFEKWLRDRGRFMDCLLKRNLVLKNGLKEKESELIERAEKLYHKTCEISMYGEKRKWFNYDPFDGYFIGGPGFIIPDKNSTHYPIPQLDFTGRERTWGYNKSERCFVTSGFARGNATIWQGDDALEQIVQNHDSVFLRMTEEFIANSKRLLIK